MKIRKKVQIGEAFGLKSTFLTTFFKRSGPEQQAAPALHEKEEVDDGFDEVGRVKKIKHVFRSLIK